MVHWRHANDEIWIEISLGAVIGLPDVLVIEMFEPLLGDAVLVSRGELEDRKVIRGVLKNGDHVTVDTWEGFHLLLPLPLLAPVLLVDPVAKAAGP